MKVTIFSMREFDEREWFERFAAELGIELVTTNEPPSASNLDLVEGSRCISVITSPIDEQLLQKLYLKGVRFISTRCIGYDHIDVAAASRIGIKVGNTPYGPDGVADYTIMMMLMCIRKMKCILDRAAVQDYTLKGIQGRELPDFTVGVIGTGRIGCGVIRRLSGFGCRILAHDLYQTEEASRFAEYTDLDRLYQEADMISLHMPLTDDNFHMINRESISRMKDGVILINTARGGLIDSEALIEGLEKGKIGAAGLDVIEDEFSLYYFDRRSEVLGNRELSILRGFPNVLVAPHMAFYTDRYLQTVVGDSLKSCRAFGDGTENPWVVNEG